MLKDGEGDRKDRDCDTQVSVPGVGEECGTIVAGGDTSLCGAAQR